MKSKLFILLALVTVFSLPVKAQTKEETEKWIVEKVNKYMTPKKLIIHYTFGDWQFKSFTPLKFSIQDNKFSVTYTYVNSSKASGESEKFDAPENRTEYVNIYSVENIVSSRLCYFLEDGNHSDRGDVFILSITLKCDCGISQSLSGKKEKISQLFIYISGNEEPDLLNRLNKALTQLKTFYPAPKDIF